MVIYGSSAPEIKGKSLNEDELDASQGTYLLDFWSYTCLDCSERASELARLHDETSLNVVGIHAPEFGFEHEENIEKAVEERDISYPVMVDNDRSAWRSFGNRERPRQVIVKDGDVVWKNAGDSESIEEALEEILGLEKVPELDFQRGHSPMLKLGYSDCHGINDKGNFKGDKQLEMPSTRKLNQVYLSGVWKQEEKYIEAKDNAVLKLKFRASQVAAVIQPEGEKLLEVRLDSSKPGHKAGEDLEDAKLRATRPEVYSIVKSGEQVHSELTLRAEPGTKIYALSFR